MRTDVLGVGFDSLTMEQAVKRAQEEIEKREGRYMVTPNPEIVWLCRKDEALRRIVAEAALTLPDGVGITLGAKILGRPLAARLPGIDVITCLLTEMAQRAQSVFLYGAKPGIAERAAENLTAKHPGLQIAGTADGYTEDGPVIEKIQALAPDLLLVCIGAPRQEKWMAAHRGKLNAGFMAGLGGALDVFSGEVRRAPKAWQKLGLEWLYRLIREPRRIGRMLRLPLFVCAVIGQRLRGK